MLVRVTYVGETGKNRAVGTPILYGQAIGAMKKLALVPALNP